MSSPAVTIKVSIRHADVDDTSKTVTAKLSLPVDTSLPSLPASVSSNPDLIGNFSYSGVHDHGPMSPTNLTPLEAAVDRAGKEINEYLSEVVEREKERDKKRKREGGIEGKGKGKGKGEKNDNGEKKREKNLKGVGGGSMG